MSNDDYFVAEPSSLFNILPGDYFVVVNEDGNVGNEGQSVNTNRILADSRSRADHVYNSMTTTTAPFFNPTRYVVFVNFVHTHNCITFMLLVIGSIINE